MKNHLRKIAVISALFILPLAQIMALPGIKPYLENTSGEFVYYKDNSFISDSVVGFLYYNEGLIATRYYSSPDEKRSLPEKDITIYITMDPESDVFRQTGEKIVGATEIGDSDIINYIRDLVYDFTKLRKNADMQENLRLSKNEVLAQFGGDIKIEFNALVPLFNIESVNSPAGKKILTLECAGRLADQNDQSFTNYRGLSSMPKEKKHDTKIAKRNPAKAQIGGQEISLDEGWKNMANMWFLDERANVSLFSLKAGNEKILTRKYKDRTARNAFQKSSGIYGDWSRNRVTEKNGHLRITSMSTDPEEMNVFREVTDIAEVEDGILSGMTFKVLENVYQANKKYFDRILDSYTIKTE